MPKRFFEFMSHDERVDCLCYGDWAKFPCEAVLLKRGDKPSGLRVLLSGEALVSIRGRPVATLEAGDVFGEMSFALARPATADVLATTAVSVLVMRPHQLDRLTGHHPRLAGALYRSLATELARRVSLRLAELQRQTLRESGTRKRHRSVLSGAKGSIY